MNKKRVFYISLIVFILLILFVLSYSFSSFFSSIEKMKEFILGFGSLAPIVFILLQISQVVLAPIPGQLTGFLGGFLFGAWLGTFYSIIGTALGTLLVVFLANKFGEPFVKKMVDKKIYDKFNNFCKNNGQVALFLVYLLPLFPDDAISFIAGLSSMKTRTIVLLAVLGRLPGMFGLSLVGSGVAQSNATTSVVILAIFMFVSLIIYLYKDKFEKWISGLFFIRFINVGW